MKAVCALLTLTLLVLPGSARADGSAEQSAAEAVSEAKAMRSRRSDAFKRYLEDFERERQAWLPRIDQCARDRGYRKLPEERIISDAVDHILKANGLAAVVCVRFIARSIPDASMDTWSNPGEPRRGVLTVESGIVKMTTNDSQFASVLGHELAHLIRHNSDREHRFSSVAREKEADRYGLRLIAAAGYEPTGAVAMHVGLEEYIAALPKLPHDAPPPDHPSESFRIEDLRELAADIPTNPLYPHPAVRAQLRLLGY